MAKDFRTIASYGRGKPRFKPQPRVLVICEDSKSCIIYLNEAARYYRAELQVEMIHCGHTDPQGIVREAVRRARNYDHVYCVVDRDSHPLFAEAEQLAREHHERVTLKPSYPCYEFWLLLHFRKVRRPYLRTATRSPGECVVRELCVEPEMEGYAKGNARGLFLRLIPKMADANRRAVEVLAEAVADGNPNPSTRLHELLQEFERLGLPTPVT